MKNEKDYQLAESWWAYVLENTVMYRLDKLVFGLENCET